MEKTYLVILEVSQKQAFIFSSNKLKENAINSAIIAWVTDKEFFNAVINDNNLFDKQKNVVYEGGGHSVLEFDTHEKAKEFVWKITLHIHQEYEGLELFAKVLECEGTIGSLKELSKELERKKSKRKSAFHQRSFGIEKVKESVNRKMPEKEKEIDEKLSPKGFERTLQLDKLGGNKNECSFIAVVHIDGNAMGTRVEKLRNSLEGESWSESRKVLNGFSKSVDDHFKSAYNEMAEEIAEYCRKGKLTELDLEEGCLPVRRIITAGDDVCFITDGRIGLECARIFIEKLASKKNEKDEKYYAACAGVAIVHQKYPFYRAYELAEELCSNAKQFIATTAGNVGAEASAEVSAIDWHIEYGEMKGGLEEIREMYETIEPDKEKKQEEGERNRMHMELRPYILLDSKGYLKNESIREYQKFRELVMKLQSGDIEYARGKLKEFRQYLKEGEQSSEHYFTMKQMQEMGLTGYQGIFVPVDYRKAFTGEELERRIFVRTADGEKRSLFFDAIEILDLFIPIEEQGVILQ